MYDRPCNEPTNVQTKHMDYPNGIKQGGGGGGGGAYEL